MFLNIDLTNKKRILVQDGVEYMTREYTNVLNRQVLYGTERYTACSIYRKG